MSKDVYSKLPNLRDGLALSYAAANKGKSRAATRAREAAYTEQKVTKDFNNLLLNVSNNQPANQLTKYSNFYDDYLKNNNPQDKNKSWNKFGQSSDLPKQK